MKRQKEMARQQKQNDKRARRLEDRDAPVADAIQTGGEDPDIAGIRPGPQPPPPWADNEGR